MANLTNTHTINVDIQLPNQLNLFPVTKFDTIDFVLRVFNNKEPVDLSQVSTAILVSTRQDGTPVPVVGAVTGLNEATFTLGNQSTAVAGRVSAIAQFYDAAGRISTVSFAYMVTDDPIADVEILEEDRTLIQVVLQNGPLVIAQAEDAGAYATGEAVRASEAEADARQAAGEARGAAEVALSKAEIANKAAEQAVVGTDNTIYQSLKERLDAEYTTVVSQIVESAYLVPKPNGINDKQIINDALIYAGQRGLNVLFPTNQIYKVTATVHKENVINVPYNNMTIDLNGSKIQLQPNGFSHYNLVNIVQKDKIKIKNGRIQGDRILHDYSNQTSPTHEFGYGVNIDRSTVTLDDVEIYDMTGDSVLTIDYVQTGASTWEDGKSVVRLVNCELHHSRRQGFSVLCSNEVYVDNCYIHSIGTSDGIAGTAPWGGIDLEPASRTQKIVKFEMRNTVIDCPVTSIVASRSCPNFKIDNCELNGRIMIDASLENPRISNTTMRFEYVDPTFTIGYANKNVEFDNCKFIVNRFEMKGVYKNCRIIGMSSPTLSNRVRIFKGETKLMNTTFENLRAPDFMGVLFNGIQSEVNEFNCVNVTIDGCDISFADKDFGTVNDYKPLIVGVRFINSYMHLLRDKQAFKDCHFENMTWRDTPSIFTQSLFKMDNCTYIDKVSNAIVNLIRKEIHNSKIEINGLGSSVFGMTGQPSYITNSHLNLKEKPIVANLINCKIALSFIRVNQPLSVTDFDSKLFNTLVEFNVP